MPLILGAQSATAAAGYSVDNSCRYNDGDSPSLTRTSPDVASTNIYKFTMAFWIKLGVPPIAAQFFDNYPGSGDEFQFYLTADRTLRIQTYDSSNKMELIPTQLFRDKSAWYHLIFSYDSTPATPSASSIRLWVNGVEVTAFDTATYPSQNQDGCFGQRNHIQYVGVGGPGNVRYYDGYLAEYIAVDGQALVNTDFGEFDSDSPTIWKPIDISGIDCGALGFYLDFKDSSNLGNDIAGNGDFTENNIVAADQATDSPTNNFCTMNPLDNFYGASTFSEGNCKMATATSPYTYNTGTMGMASGKWYAECKLAASGGYSDIGMAANSSRSAINPLGTATYAEGYAKLDANANLCYDGSCSTYGDALAVGDVVGIYIDLDNLKLYYGIDGVIQNSGTGYTIAVAAAATTSGFYRFAGGDEDGASGSTLEWNFGGCPSFALTSAVNDANGYGNFEYDPSDGGSASFDGSAKNFLALCTKNLGSDGG